MEKKNKCRGGGGVRRRGEGGGVGGVLRRTELLHQGVKKRKKRKKAAAAGLFSFVSCKADEDPRQLQSGRGGDEKVERPIAAKPSSLMSS